ncbi:MAG: Nre family DNA repair protein [Candidatus Aenigmatarchaeota archaeon]
MKSICLACKGRGWCGINRCPILSGIFSKIKLEKKIKKPEIFGSTPPSVFVGRYGYPQVNVGILLPSETGDTSIMDSPTVWFKEKMDITNILIYRASLVNSRRKKPVKSGKNDKFIETVQEASLSSKPIDTEVKLNKIPKFKINFDFNTTPFGPSATVEKVELAENPKVPKRVEYITSDTDLKAEEAILDLYIHGNDVYYLSKVLSVGLLGLKPQRKLVPTRWSITAVDSIISDNLLEKIKTYPEISEYLLFESNYIGNYFEVLLIPHSWMFEQVEMAVPGGLWSKNIREPSVINDYEFYHGRKTYAKDVAGAYYSGKLAVLEYLERIKRQAGVLIVREIRPEYFSEVGVWKVRETVREALTRKPLVFESLEYALKRIDMVLKIKSDFWIKKSKIIDYLKKQKRIFDYL